MIPVTIQKYLQRYFATARYSFDHLGYGPTHKRAYSDNQLKFLADVADATHNLFSPNGVAYFYKNAARINQAWENDCRHLDEQPFFQYLVPLPEANDPHLDPLASPSSGTDYESSSITQHHIVMASDLNHMDSLMGGKAMELADRCGATCCMLAYPTATFVTKRFEAFDFLTPAKLGDVLAITSVIKSVGTTSVVVLIDGLNAKTGTPIFSTSAVFVNAVGGIKQPLPIK